MTRFQRLMRWGDLVTWTVILVLLCLALIETAQAGLTLLNALDRHYLNSMAWEEAGSHWRRGVQYAFAFGVLFLLLTIRARINAGLDTWAAHQMAAARQRDLAELDGYRPLIDRRP